MVCLLSIQVWCLYGENVIFVPVSPDLPYHQCSRRCSLRRASVSTRSVSLDVVIYDDASGIQAVQLRSVH